MFQNADEETQEPQWLSAGTENIPENNNLYVFSNLCVLKKKKKRKTEQNLNRNNCTESVKTKCSHCG
jgi:hypothetical protein